MMILIAVIALSACSGGDETPTPDVVNTSPQDTPIVADGRLVPRQYAYIPFMNSGKVNEILVEVGQHVEKDQVMARLERTTQLDYAIDQARYELRSAERALELAATKDQQALEARVAAAQKQLQIAENAPADLELRAPFAGTVMDIDLFIGQYVTTGQNAILLADLSEWFIETDNLTEIEVVNVNVGQQVTVVPDALPNMNMTGEVASISSVFEEKRGDITYTVRISVPITDPRLRWGMTVSVTFNK